MEGLREGERQAAPSPACSVEEVPLLLSGTSHARCHAEVRRLRESWVGCAPQNSIYAYGVVSSLITLICCAHASRTRVR